MFMEMQVLGERGVLRWEVGGSGVGHGGTDWGINFLISGDGQLLN